MTLAVGVLVTATCKKPAHIVVDEARHCRLCGTETGHLYDTLVVVVDKKAIRNAVSKSGIRHYDMAEGKQTKLATKRLVWKLHRALERGERTFSVSTFKDTCDSCLDAPVKVKVGVVYKCKYCEEQYAEDTRSHNVKRRDFVGDSIQVKSGVCSSRACKLRSKHPGWTLADCRTIVERSIRIGFNKEQAIAAWGRPDDINRTVGAWGTREQWVYRRGSHSAQYLYFENGVLSSFQD